MVNSFADSFFIHDELKGVLLVKGEVINYYMCIISTTEPKVTTMDITIQPGDYSKIGAVVCHEVYNDYDPLFNLTLSSEEDLPVFMENNKTTVTLASKCPVGLGDDTVWDNGNP